MKHKLDKLWTLVVVGNQKALVALVVAAVGGLLLQVGVTLDMTVEEALQALSVALITAVSVWFKSNE